LCLHTVGSTNTYYLPTLCFSAVLLPHKIVMAPGCGHMICYIIRGGADVQSHTRTHVIVSHPPSLLNSVSLPAINRRCLHYVLLEGKMRCSCCGLYTRPQHIWSPMTTNHCGCLLLKLACSGAVLFYRSTQLEKSPHDEPLLSICQCLQLAATVAKTR
jgi:hypothetical protein